MEGTIMEDHFEILNMTVKADAFASLRMHTGAGVVRILGGWGLRNPMKRRAEGFKAPLVAELVSGSQGKRVLSAKGPFPDDPFLSVEGAMTVLVTCMDFGAEHLVTSAMRRRAEAFTRAEKERFGTIARVFNLKVRCRLMEEENVRLRITDPLTGLDLFPAFHEALGKELSRARRNAGKVTVGILEVEEGKGPVSGGGAPKDETIVLIAGVLKDQLRNFDTLVRYSPSEFAIVLPDRGGGQSQRGMDRVLRALSSAEVKGFPVIHLGFSCYPEDGSTDERLIETAEAAMNLAREKGRTAASRWKS
jgi:diguanylate cyclase (GGDEF)-like protein